MTGWDVLLDANTQWVLAGCVLLGVSSGILGCFAFLRGRSLMGDALAHAALPGVCLAYLLTGSKSIPLFLIGAGLAGLLSTSFMSMICRHTRIKEDTAMALTLSVFFGFGIVLLTYIQHSGGGNQSGLDKFLFGQAASLVGSDIYTMIVAALILIALTTLLFKELKLLCFDSGYGQGLGFPIGLIDALLMLMLLTVVVIGLQAVGVVLVAAMLITPAVTARYWTDSLGTMVWLSALFGALGGALGTLFSTLAEDLPTGPLIVLAVTAFFLVSLLFSPRRGVLFRLARFLRLRQKVRNEDILLAWYEQMEQDVMEERVPAGYTAETLAIRAGKQPGVVKRTLVWLGKKGLAQKSEETPRPVWHLTPEGLAKAYELVLNQRLWDLYAMNEHRYPFLSIDKNGDELTKQLPDGLLQQMLADLQAYNLAPKLAPNRANRLHKQTTKQASI